MQRIIRLICPILVITSAYVPAVAEDLTRAIRAFLQHRVEVENRNIGIVVGVVVGNGSDIISYGKLDRDSDQEVNGDTVFEIGSVTKTFTGLLLQDMVERGEMTLNDSLAGYLPEFVNMPSRNGKAITLLQLATHTSGLPTSSITWVPELADDPRAGYTIEKMYEVLSGYRLSRDPGTEYEYSTLGIALLGQAIALRAGIDYESLLVERISRPLEMNSTRITPTPEMKERLATGHNYCGYVVPRSYWGALAPGASLRSTANDLLKYVAAHLGLTQSSLTPIMEKTHLSHFHAHMKTDTGMDTDLGLAWMITDDGTSVIQHGGLTDGFIAFVCFDLTRRRGVVVLSNLQDFEVPAIGYLLLESEWQSDRRPKETDISRAVSYSLPGQYRQATEPGTTSSTILGIRCEGDRFFARTTGTTSWRVDALLPPMTVELLAESETRLFERLSTRTVTVSRDDQGNVTGLTVHHRGKEVAYDKISDQPPEISYLPQPRVAVELDTEILEAYTGQYDFTPSEAFPVGMTLTVRRDGNQLVGHAQGQNAIQGAFDIYSTSETEFFIKINGAQLTFIKDDARRVTAVVHHSYRGRFPNCEGRKVSESSH